ncbi:GNAT family N-acetyltransferase [Tahibacter sp.]|uniref:GNAT family N-acetyltransferase n=1 Tax=Tahibacter sp. TaxID=2056211 RepID=UPI0039C9B45A
MTEIRIRAATRGDIAFLVDANAAMALETEDKPLDRERLTRGVTSVFADARRGFYRIAEHEGRPVGCLLVTYEWSDWRDGDWWWIQSVYVMPDARRLGVFRAMYAQVEADARATAGVIGLRLYVEWENERAQRTYAALGMTQEHYHMFARPFVALT